MAYALDEVTATELTNGAAAAAGPEAEFLRSVDWQRSSCKSGWADGERALVFTALCLAIYSIDKATGNLVSCMSSYIPPLLFVRYTQLTGMISLPRNFVCTLTVPVTSLDQGGGRR